MKPEDDRDEIAALRRENAILRETLDAIDGTVVVYDGERRFVMANRAYHSFFPHLPPDSELIGLRYEEVLALSLEAGRVMDTRAQTSPDTYVATRIREFEQQDASPREVKNARTGRWYLIRVQRTPTGNRVALRVEITDQKRMQEELRLAREAAEQASRAKSQFLSAVSHDLRTPLNAVINFARLLHEEIHGPLGSSDYKEYADTIVQSGTELLHLIDDILEYARADAGEVRLDRHWINLRGLIQSLARTTSTRAAKTGVTLETDFPTRLPPILADRPRLWRALASLLGNAVNLTRPGGIARIGASVPDDDTVEITITHSDPTMTEADIDRSSRPFEALAAHGLRAPGIGLGLPLAYQVIRAHGGSLIYEVRPGEGSRIAIRLPADSPPDEADPGTG